MKFIDNITVEKYDEFVHSAPNANILQSSKWVDVKKEWGYKRLAVVDNNDQVIATAQLLTRSGLWYLNRGPIMDYSNIELLEFFLENIKVYAKKNKAKMLKIDIPEPIRNASLQEFRTSAEDSKKDAILSAFNKARFKHKGFTSYMSDTIQPRFEVVKILSDNFIDELPKDTRRLIRDADKKFVVSRRIGLENLDDFVYAIQCTEKRKGISLRNKEYFENMMKVFGDDIILYVSYIDLDLALDTCKQRIEELNKQIEEVKEKSPKKVHQLKEQVVSNEKLIEVFSKFEKQGDRKEQIISGSFTVRCGNYAEMIYAGMDEQFLKLPAQYKVYADSMTVAREMGVEYFSSGGIENSLEDSLLLFKSKFNPNVVEHYGEFDFAISKTYQFMYDYALPLRRKVLKTMRSILKKN
ncbi:MAG: peptidoglycan bridge formation glycyltransferase FemA/FemB family protein [Gemella sp.]|nr:peptidoglycan bridge formation glycyltransferase FemA/FemB family protein [Gemella sp.]